MAKVVPITVKLKSTGGVSIPVGPSTIAGLVSAVGAAVGAVVAAYHDKSQASITAAVYSLAVLVAVITSRTSQHNTLVRHSPRALQPLGEPIRGRMDAVKRPSVPEPDEDGDNLAEALAKIKPRVGKIPADQGDAGATA